MGSRVAAIVVAAGSGSRLGADLPKALVPVGGVPLVARAVENLRAGGVDVVVVAAPATHLDAVRTALADDGAFPADSSPAAEMSDGVQRTVVVEGGSSRQASVAAALRVLPEADVVLVHDAARCFAPPALVARVVAAVRAGHCAVVPVVAVTDTLVAAADDGPVGEYEDRSRLRAVQTPQGFDRATLERAHAVAADRAAQERDAATDDASLALAIGETVWAVPGDDAAMKITTPRDLALAEHALARSSSGLSPTALGPVNP